MKEAFQAENSESAENVIFMLALYFMIWAYLGANHHFKLIQRHLESSDYERFYFYASSIHTRLFFSSNFSQWFRWGYQTHSKHLLRSCYYEVKWRCIFKFFYLRFLLSSSLAWAVCKAGLWLELYLFFYCLQEISWLFYFAESKSLSIVD